MASEQFSLCWDNFHKNMSSGMNSLLENEDLVDVTLAVEGKCLKAHKMVLSVCSPYFKELFKSNPCQHPIVFMKDVSYVALSDLLQFMYQGEVQVSQENLTTFIKTAEALQIKGLTGDGNGSADNDSVDTTHEKPVQHVEEYRPTPQRPKKQPAPASTPSAPVKRPRVSVSSTDSQPAAPAAVAKTEPVASTPSVTEPPVHFKMEPYDQSQSLIDDAGDENFGDDNLDDTNVDDTEDYSMMEGGMGEEEPQAGTSTDGAGEGQDADSSDDLMGDCISNENLIEYSLQDHTADEHDPRASNDSPNKETIVDEHKSGSKEEIKVSDFLLVKFAGKRMPQYYVGVVVQITNSVTETDVYMVKFLRKREGNFIFVFPLTEDISRIDKSDIESVLPLPEIDNRNRYTFNFNFDHYSKSLN